MADEIKVSVSLRADKGTLKVELVSKSIQVDMAGDDYYSGTQAIGSTEEAVVIGDVTTPGYCYFENLDPTNSISIRAATGLANTITLLPDEVCLYRASAAGFFAISSAGTPKLKKLILEA